MKRLIGLTTLLLLLLALPAAGTQCETFTNHSGFVPDGWTATFTENNIGYGPFVGPTFVDPETAYEGNRSWDTAVKCRTGTTTTTENTTTTSLPPPTTTTLPTSTSTVSGSTTTTDNPATTISETSTTTGPPAPSSTAPTPSTVGSDAPIVLPFTGSSDIWLIVGALSLLTGVAVLTSTRREDT